MKRVTIKKRKCLGCPKVTMPARQDISLSIIPTLTINSCCIRMKNVLGDDWRTVPWCRLGLLPRHRCWLKKMSAQFSVCVEIRLGFIWTQKKINGFTKLTLHSSNSKIFFIRKSTETITHHWCLCNLFTRKAYAQWPVTKIISAGLPLHIWPSGQPGLAGYAAATGMD